MIINSMTEVHEDLIGDTRPQARKKQPSSIQITYSRYDGSSSMDGPTKLKKKNGQLKGGIRLSMHDVFAVNCGNKGVFEEVL